MSFCTFLAALGFALSVCDIPAVSSPTAVETREGTFAQVSQPAEPAHPLPPSRPLDSDAPPAPQPSGAAEATKPQPAPPAVPLTCELRIAGSGDKRMLVAVVNARDPAQGSFTLELTKSGVNRIRSRQSGEFSVQAGQSETLAKVSLNLSRGDEVKGRLDLRSPTGNVTRCATL